MSCMKLRGTDTKSTAQGNGDLKAHLLVKYGPDKLSQYYDKRRNWAVRKGEEVNFDRD